MAISDIAKKVMEVRREMLNAEGTEETTRYLYFLCHDDGPDVYAAFVAHGTTTNPRKYVSQDLRRFLQVKIVGRTKLPQGTMRVVSS